MRKILITGALPYANGHLHLGHMLGYIQSDIWARYQKIIGNECHYICGSDTHGTPIMLRAKSLGIPAESMIQDILSSHIDDFSKFNINFDNYLSTHNNVNRDLVNHIYQQLVSNSLIEKKIIKQAYDDTAKMFLPDRYIKGTCPHCKSENQYGDSCESCGATYGSSDLINPTSTVTGQSPILKESEHYFFKLSSCSESLSDWICNHAQLQDEVKNKLQEWFIQGLNDWDISRDEPYFGFPIPNTDNKKYFYVWLDAPIGYLASFKVLCDKINIDFNEYWKQESTELYHFIGKDIMYFHALFWPAILENSGYRKPSGVFVNGFLTIDGKKMSKSRGTFISCKTYLKHLDPDYLRYYFASKLTQKVDDLDLNLKDFITKTNSDLVGKIVNIASRSSGFINKSFNGLLADELQDCKLHETFKNNSEIIKNHYEKREFSHAMRAIMSLADQANQFIDHYKPWQLLKNNEHAIAHRVASQAINLFRMLIGFMKPVIPDTAQKAELFLNSTINHWGDILIPLYNHKINSFKPLARRIETSSINDIIEDSKQEHTLTNKKDRQDEDETMGIKPEIQYDDFSKLDLRVAKVIEASNVEGSQKLIKIVVDIGPETRQIFSGIKSAYTPEQLIGKNVVLVANLAPRKMRFGVSEGMILSAGDNKEIYVIEPNSNAKPGMTIE